MGVDRQAGAGGQHRVKAEGQARGIDHFLDLGRNDLGHAHATEERIAANADPAPFGISVVCLDEARRGAHRAVVPVATLFVGGTAQRRDGLAGDLAGLLQHGHGRIGIDCLGKTGQLRPECGHVEDFIEDEAHIAQGRFIFSHDNLSLSGSGRPMRAAALG